MNMKKKVIAIIGSAIVCTAIISAAQLTPAQAYTWSHSNVYAIYLNNNSAMRFKTDVDKTAISVEEITIASKNIAIPAVCPDRRSEWQLPIVRIEAGCFENSKIRKVTLGKNIEQLQAGSFKNSKVNAVVLKSKKLAKKSAVKGAFKGSSADKVTVTVKVGSKTENAKYLKKYRKVLTKANCGKTISVK